MVITAHVTQACNDKREVVPTLKQIAALPGELGVVQTLVADNGFYSQANVVACAQAGLTLTVHLKVAPTPNPSFRRIDAQVFDNQSALLRVSTVQGRF